MPDAAARIRGENISATAAAATAHSPPTPRPTRKRNAINCQTSWASAETPVKTE